VGAAPEVSVVVCTRDGAHRLPTTLAHLRGALDRTALATEVVLVDNASTDGTPDLLAAATAADPRLRVVAEPRPGIARARNRGVAAARAPVVLFTDDDVRVPPDWVERLSAPLRRGDADLVGGSVALAPHLHRGWLTPALASAYFAVVPEPPVVGREFAAASIGTTRAVLDAVPFDEALGTARYPGAEDTVFRLDVLNAGFRQGAVPGATVEHHPDPHRLDPARLARQATGRGRGEAYLAHHLHGRRPPPATALAKLAVTGGLLLARRTAGHARGGVDEEELRLRRRMAFHRETLALRREIRRRPPAGR
jgi:GT2 family glycosyltransferase